MKKSEFFDENIVAFEVGKGHHHEPHHHEPHSPEPHIGPLSLRTAYYEWSKPQNKWLKIREEDPNPDQSIPNGNFDGQVIEVEL